MTLAAARLAQRAARSLAETLAELVGEAAVAFAACLLAGVVLGAAVWGWNRHPAATMAAGAAVALLVAYGAWQLRPAARHERRSRPTRLLAGIAASFAVVVIVWLVVVVSYCACVE